MDQPWAKRGVACICKSICKLLWLSCGCFIRLRVRGVCLDIVKYSPNKFHDAQSIRWKSCENAADLRLPTMEIYRGQDFNFIYISEFWQGCLGWLVLETHGLRS